MYSFAERVYLQFRIFCVLPGCSLKLVKIKNLHNLVYPVILYGYELGLLH
jgi:hypothetical protein